MKKTPYSLIGNMRPIDDELNLRFSGAGRKRRAGRLLVSRRRAAARGQASPFQISYSHYTRRFRVGQFQAAQQPKRQAITAIKERIAVYYAARWASRGFMPLDISRAAQAAQERLTATQKAEVKRIITSFSLISISDGAPSIEAAAGTAAASAAPSENMTGTEAGTQ